MHDQQIRTGGGAVLFWRIGDQHRRDEIAQVLADLGLSRLMPEARKPNQILRDAIADLYSGERCDITPVKRGGWQVTGIDRRNDRNDYRPLFIASVDKHDMIRVDALDRDAIVEMSTRHRLDDSYAQLRDLLRGAAITDLLIGAVVDEWDGTTLRPAGGVYWLADQYLDRFGQLAQACEAASLDSKTSVYRVNHALDADALRAVHDAIVAEVERDTAELHRGLDELERESSIERRRDSAQAIRGKVAVYEGILGTSLPALHASVEAASQAAAKAAITLAIKAQAEAQNAA